MNVETWPLARIKPYPQNPRKIPKAAVSKIALSLRTFGWRQPMVVEPDGTLVVGHGRLLGAKENGWTEGPVHVADNLTPEQIKAYRLMDNRSHDEATWDWNLVGVELGDLSKFDVDLSLTGFDPGQRPEFSADVLPKVGKEKQLRKRWATELGQHWNIGPHRLVIGDARCVTVEPCDGICSDPPFDLTGDSICDVIERWSEVAILLCSDRQFCALAAQRHLHLAFVHVRRSARSIPVRARTNPVLRHTMIGVFTGGRSSGWKRPKPNYSTLIEVDHEYDMAGNGGHCKHPAVFQEMLAGFSWERVCDPFAGYGSVILACEQSGRRCISVEIDPGIAAVALDRLERAGLKPTLERLSDRDTDATAIVNRRSRRARAESQSERRSLA